MDKFLIKQPNKKQKLETGAAETSQQRAPPSLQESPPASTSNEAAAQFPSKLVSWNCNSLRLRAGKDLESAVKSFLSQGVDALLLQETRIKPEDQATCEAALRSAGFKNHLFYWGMHPNKQRYSGTAVVVSKACRPLSVRYSKDMTSLIQGRASDYKDRGQDKWQDPEEEGRLVMLEYPQAWLVCVYTPNCSWFAPGRSRREDWDARFAACIKVLMTGREGVCPPTSSAATNANGFFAKRTPSNSGRTSVVQGKPVVLLGDLNVCPDPLDVSHPTWFENAMKPTNVGQADPGLQGQPGYTPQERERFHRLLIQECGLVDTFRALYPDKQRLTWGWGPSYATGRYADKFMGLDFALISQSLYDAGIVVDSTILGQNEEGCFGSDHAPILLHLDWSKAPERDGDGASKDKGAAGQPDAAGPPAQTACV